MTTTEAIWLMGCINTVLLLVLLVVITSKPKKSATSTKLTNTELDAVLNSSSKEVANATDKALQGLGERLASQFTYLVDIHTKNVVSAFESNLEKATSTALLSYNEQLLRLRDEADKSFNDSRQKIMADIEATEQQIKDLTTKRQQTTVSKVEDELTELVEAYLKQAMPGGIDLAVQQDFIMQQLEKLRPSLLEDLKHVGS